MSGYWATGRLYIATAPASVMTMEMTDAKIGRSMQKCEMFIGGRLSASLRDLDPPRLGVVAAARDAVRPLQRDPLAGHSGCKQRVAHRPRPLQRDPAVALGAALAVGVTRNLDRGGRLLERARDLRDGLSACFVERRGAVREVNRCR